MLQNPIIKAANVFLFASVALFHQKLQGRILNGDRNMAFKVWTPSPLFYSCGEFKDVLENFIVSKIPLER